MYEPSDFLTLGEDVVRLARAAGATDCDVVVAAGTEFEVTVRNGDIDKLLEAGSRALGLRVFVDGRSAICYTSDFSPAALKGFAREAVELAAITDVDPCAGLPDPEDWASQFSGDLQLFDERMAGVSNDTKIDLARRCERAAYDFDKRI